MRSPAFDRNDPSARRFPPPRHPWLARIFSVVFLVAFALCGVALFASGTLALASGNDLGWQSVILGALIAVGGAGATVLVLRWERRRTSQPGSKSLS